ncbi:Neurexin-1 [Schistosoma japonicum]|uniref:Neurexin-1 n=1 Tax=Schistosoma japonicum TaxID=6182 RepID=A0A4Z2DJD5_SCHJA|nr:Neurexin-1 [Schistosoma japonicum]
MHLYETFNLQFSFRTSQEHGLLLFNSNKQGVDFIAFELISSYLHFVFDMGSGSQRHTLTMHKVADSDWHHVELSRIDLENNTFLLYVDRNKINVQFIKITIQNSDIARNFNLNDPLFIGGTSKYTFMKWRGKLNSYHGFQGCLSNFTINGLITHNLLHLSKQKYSLNWTIPMCYDQIISGCIERPKNALNCNAIQQQSKQFNVKKDSNVNNQQLQFYCLNDGLCLHSWNTVKCACELTSFNGHRCTKPGTTFLYGSYHNRSTDIVSNNWNMTVMNEPIGYLRLLYKDHVRNTRQDEFILGIQMFPVKIHNKSNYSMSVISTLLYVTSNIQKGDFMHLFLESGKVKLNYDMGGGIVHITGPNILVNDGLYHRIRGYRVDHQIILEVDYIRQTNEVNSAYGKGFNNQEVIWVGHAPTLNKTDIFHGYMSGVYYNGLLLNDLAAGLLYLPFIQVAKFGSVEYVPTFQPLLAKSLQSEKLTSLIWIDSKHQSISRMPADSETTYINQNQYNYDIIPNVKANPHQFLQFINSSTSFSSLDLKTNNDTVTNISSSNNHTFNINYNPLHSNKWNWYNKLKSVYMQVNLWLLISMTSVGVILLILLTILAYKCHHTKNKYDDCLHSEEIINDRLHKSYLSNNYVNVNRCSSNSLLKLDQIDYNKVKSFTEQFTTSSCYLPHIVYSQIPVTETYSSVTTIKPTSIIFVNESTDLPISSTLITTNECVLHNKPITHLCHISVNKSVIEDVDKCTLSSIEVDTNQPVDNKTILT